MDKVIDSQLPTQHRGSSRTVQPSLENHGSLTWLQPRALISSFGRSYVEFCYVTYPVPHWKAKQEDKSTQEANTGGEQVQALPEIQSQASLSHCASPDSK